MCVMFIFFYGIIVSEILFRKVMILIGKLFVVYFCYIDYLMSYFFKWFLVFLYWMIFFNSMMRIMYFYFWNYYIEFFCVIRDYKRYWYFWLGFIYWWIYCSLLFCWWFFWKGIVEFYVMNLYFVFYKLGIVRILCLNIIFIEVWWFGCNL